MVKEKFVLLQPTHHNGVQPEPNFNQWTNDPFINTAKFFNCPLYNINNDIPLVFDVYWLCHFSIADIEKEIELIKKVKSMGKKVFITFSHDLRFLLGDEHLMSFKTATLYTELCELADAIGGGVSSDLRMFGRFQHKVIPFGDVLQNVNFSNKAWEDRNIDILLSGAVGGQFLAFGIEFLLSIKERFPERRAVCLVPQHFPDLITELQKKYPQIEFPKGEIPHLITWLQDSKVYANLEMRPRPVRALYESYYCRVPFLSYSGTYFSKLCTEYTYDKMDIVGITDKYSDLYTRCQDDYYGYSYLMEERARFDFFDNVYQRMVEALGL